MISSVCVLSVALIAGVSLHLNQSHEILMPRDAPRSREAARTPANAEPNAATVTTKGPLAFSSNEELLEHLRASGLLIDEVRHTKDSSTMRNPEMELKWHVHRSRKDTVNVSIYPTRERAASAGFPMMVGMGVGSPELATGDWGRFVFSGHKRRIQHIECILEPARRSKLSQADLAIFDLWAIGAKFTFQGPFHRPWAVNLAGCTVTDSAGQQLALFDELEIINISNTAFTDVGLAHLGHMTSLRQIHIGGTRISNAGLAHMRQALPQLTVNRTPIEGFDNE